MNHIIRTKYTVTFFLFYVVIMGVMLNLTIGCAEQSGDNNTLSDSDPYTSYSNDNDPVKTLINLAMTEPGGLPVNYPPPPAIDPDDIIQYAKNDAKAFMSFDAVLNELINSQEQPVTNTPDTRINPVEPDNDALRESTALYLQGREEYLEGNYYESIRNLEQALRFDPNGTAIIRLLAYNYLQTVGRSKAITYFQKINEINPRDSEALLHLGLAAYDRKDWNRSALYLANLVNNPQSATDEISASNKNTLLVNKVLAAYKLGSALFNLGYANAGIFMWEATAIPENINRADTQYIQQDFNELIRNRAMIKLGIGDARARLGQYDNALNAYEQAASLPVVDRGAILDRLVYVQLRQGRPYAAMLSIMRGITTPNLSKAAIKLVHHYADLPSSTYLGQALAYEAMRNTDSLPLIKAAASVLPEDITDSLIDKYISEHPSDEILLLNIVDWAFEEYGIQQAMQYYIQYSDPDNYTGRQKPARRLALKISDPDIIEDAWSNIKTDLKSSTSARMFHVWMLYTAAEYAAADNYVNKLIEQQPSLIAPQLLKIEILIKREQRDEARTALNTIELSSITPNPELLEQYIELHKKINLNEKGIAELQVVLDKYNTDISEPDDRWTTIIDGFTLRDIKYYLAQLYVNSNNLSQANLQLRAILDYDPGDARVYAALLNMYGPDGLEPDQEVFRDLTGDIARNLREHNLFRYLRAKNDTARGRYNQAINEYQQLAEEDPDNSQAIDTLIYQWISTDQIIQAQQWLNKQISKWPGDVRFLRWLVNVLVQDRQYENALNNLESWIDKHPLDENTAKIYESILVLNGDKEKARQSALNRLARRPESFARACALAEYTISIKDYSNTLKYLMEAIRLSIDREPFRLEKILRIAAKQADQDPDNSKTVFEFINHTINQWQADGYTISRQSHIWGIDAAIRVGQTYDNVILKLDQACREYPQDLLQFTVYTVVLFNNSDREDDACHLMDTFLNVGTENVRKLTSQDIPITSRRIQLAAQRSEVELAINLVRRLSDDDLLGELKEIADEIPGNEKIKLADALYSLSGLFYRADDQTASEEILQVTLRTDPQHPGANNDLGYALADKGITLDKAEKMLLIAYISDTDNEAFIDSLGWLRYKQGRFKDTGTEPENLGAATLLLAASMDKDGRNDPVILDHLGDTYWRLNQIEDAIKTWNRVKFVYRDQLDMAKNIDEDYENNIRAAYEDVVKNAESKIKSARDGKRPNVAPCPSLDGDK